MRKYARKFVEQKGADAYFTLEAAFLVPTAFFLIALIIHLTFLMYGRSALVQDAYLLAFRASLLKEDEDELSFIASIKDAQLGTKYFGNTVPDLSTEKDGAQIIVRLKNQTNRTAFDIGKASPWQTESAARAWQVDVPKRIRKIDRIADIAVLMLKGKENSSGKTEGN